MRIFATATVALSFTALTACLGNPGEPLGALGDRDERVNEARVPGVSIAAPELLTARAISRTAPGNVEQPPVDEPAAPDEFTQQAIADVAASIDYASLQAFAVADAGVARDRNAAELAAIELANAAVLVQQRANEMRALSSTAGEGGADAGGCPGGAEPTEPTGGELPAPVEDAVTLAVLAAEVGAEIAEQLDPPSETVCGSGCGATCTEVPGQIDEGALEGAIDEAETVGNDAAELGSELDNLGVFG